jgi:hypothetical protein
MTPDAARAPSVMYAGLSSIGTAFCGQTECRRRRESG